MRPASRTVRSPFLSSAICSDSSLSDTGPTWFQVCGYCARARCESFPLLRKQKRVIDDSTGDVLAGHGMEPIPMRRAIDLEHHRPMLRLSEIDAGIVETQRSRGPNCDGGGPRVERGRLCAAATGKV